MNKKIICFVGIGIASLCALIGVVLLIQNIEKRSGEELCRTGVLNYERGNRDEAVKCWEKAADKGDVLALQLLAEEYQFRCYKGEVEKGERRQKRLNYIVRPLPEEMEMANYIRIKNMNSGIATRKDLGLIKIANRLPHGFIQQLRKGI